MKPEIKSVVYSKGLTYKKSKSQSNDIHRQGIKKETHMQPVGFEPTPLSRPESSLRQ